MDTEKLYQSIFRRRSIRKYDMAPLESSVIDEVSKLIPSLKPLYDIKIHISLVPGNTIRGMMAVRSPHYLILSSEKKDGYLENAGFILQQMDLALSSMGLGSCWAGLAKPPEDLFIKPGMEFVIALAFGKSMGSPHRESLSEFKRKPLLRIADTHEDPILEAARLAPSSTNSQPWYFKRIGNLIHAYCIRSNRIKAILFEKLNRIDMGIAFCHIWLAGLHMGKNPHFARNTEAPEVLSGYDYILTVSDT